MARHDRRGEIFSLQPPTPFFHHIVATMPPRRQVGSEYGHCLCNICLGALRTRRTIAVHTERLQIRKTKHYRFCHCSQHSGGQLVHRSTRINHRADDINKNLNEEDIDPQWIAQFLADQENANASRAGIASAIRRQRDKAFEGQFNQNDPQYDENIDSDNDNDDGNLLYQLDDDPDDIDEDEQLDTVEAGAPADPLGGALPDGTIYSSFLNNTNIFR